MPIPLRPNSLPVIDPTPQSGLGDIDLCALLAGSPSLIPLAGPQIQGAEAPVLEIAASAPFAGENKVLIIAASRAYHEAQNALLKIFEEPTADTHFFLVMPSSEGLLPTLKSRLYIVEGESGNRGEAEAKGFLSATKPKRLEIVKKMTDEISDEKKTKIV